MSVRAARWLQRILFTVGFLILGYCGASWLNSRIQQAQGNRELDRILARRPTSAAAVPNVQIPEGGLIGRVEIPRLHLSVVIFQGTGNSVLNHGVGHLDGSALPGQAGNVVLAAHRDTFFRSLRDIQKGDTITVTTLEGRRRYRVEATEIVDPTEVSVADPTVKPTLTLITCYPFYFVGHAPKRFIVRARDIDAGSDIAPAVPVKAARSQTPAGQKETARAALSEQAPSEEVATEEPSSSRRTPAENAQLTYVFKASE